MRLSLIPSVYIYNIYNTGSGALDAAGSKTQMGGTMRLGTRRTLLKTSACHAASLYNSQTVDERSPPPRACAAPRTQWFRSARMGVGLKGIVDDTGDLFLGGRGGGGRAGGYGVRREGAQASASI